jgi:L-seryl-tRNA(Ser) seleniumtransferase
MRLKDLPSVDRILQDARLAAAIARHGRELVVEELRAELEARRAVLKAGGAVDASRDAVVAALLERLEMLARPSLRRVYNLSGTVLHTNLGRAPLPPAAAEAAALSLREPANLEYDLERGERGERDEHLEALLCRLTGAESATAVNNNAGAVLLALHALAAGREVIVSRGEMVEIGGSFRIPEIVEASGCTLREVGTTNRTHLRDYERAIGPRTAAILKVHASNYAVVGFTAIPAEGELARLAHERKLPFLNDLGSGSLVDLARWGLPREPTPAQALAAGADLVTFSGDKLLGGPQAGLAVGRADLVEKLRRSPLKRALRLDKGRIAALEIVLRLYLDPDRLPGRLPALRLLARPQAEIAALAERLRPVLQQYCGAHGAVSVAPCASQVGSGSLPVDRLPSAALRIAPASPRLKAAQIAERLRRLPVPVIARVHEDAVWLDLRCLEDEEGFAAQLRGRALDA